MATLEHEDAKLNNKDYERVHEQLKWAIKMMNDPSLDDGISAQYMLHAKELMGLLNKMHEKGLHIEEPQPEPETPKISPRRAAILAQRERRGRLAV